MPNRVLILSVALILGKIFALSAQPLETTENELNTPISLFESIQGELFELEIQARVIENEDNIIWNVDINEFTILGRALNLRLNGGNVIVEADLTPYRQNENNIMLVVRAETWVNTQTSNKIAYQTSVNSIPINSEEPVVFYPLGIDPRNGNTVNLEIEISVSQYEGITADQ